VIRSFSTGPNKIIEELGSGGMARVSKVIDQEVHAKIMDFGIARPVVKKGGAKGITDGGMAIGTPQYMAPEQAEARGVDARSDLYTLGVILYEMLTGRPPFDGDTPLAVAMKHKLEAPRDPLELNVSMPTDGAVAAVIRHESSHDTAELMP
jgi:serine/threonine protein kinase